MAFGTDTAAFKLLECQRACDAKDADIAQLRADLAEARGKLDRLRPTNEICSAREAARRRMRLDGADAQALEHALTITERERDEARADLARVTAELDEAIEDRRQARDDAARAAALLAVRTMERDARPAISRVDARRYVEWRDGFSPHPANVDRLEPVDDALRAHAAGSVAAEASDGGAFGPVSYWLSKVPSIKRESLGTWRANECAACEGSGYANACVSAAGARTCPACNGSGRKGGSDA